MDANRTRSSLSTDPITWLQECLQDAIELEFATLPPYLAAMFSLKQQNYVAYNKIRTVAMEEMVHLAIACNIKAALGGSPQLKNIQTKISYPTTKGFLGFIEPDLQVGLTKYSKPQLSNFLRIERPDKLVRLQNETEQWPTIASLYTNIQAQIRANADAVCKVVRASGHTSNQVPDNIGIKTVDSKQAMTDPVQWLCDMIDEILQQGEGSKDLITDNTYQREASHYARFGSLYYGREFQEPDPMVELNPINEEKFFLGRKINDPEVVNTLAVPTDGYTKLLSLDHNRSAVIKALEAFDDVISSLLGALDDAWNGKPELSWPRLGDAVHSMIHLRVACCYDILTNKIPDDLVDQLPTLYPDEIEFMRKYTDFEKPIFYGPRFFRPSAPRV